MNSKQLQRLIDAWCNNDLSEDQADRLNQILRESEEARRTFSAEAELHGLLHCAAAEDAVDRVANMASVNAHAGNAHAGNAHVGNARQLRGWRAGWLQFASVIAATLVLAWGIQWWWMSSTKPNVVATLASSENAAWESVLPTTPGSKLPPGLLDLRTGIATIQFNSGANVIVEAPARLELVSSMRFQNKPHLHLCK